jgi:O-6-methylguanine DNA methyltransferase
VTAFARRVLAMVRRIPTGRVTTYGDLARLAGKPGAARAVGNVLRAGGEPGLPYHRVIASGGQIGGYGRDPQLKRALLAAEGHTIRRRRLLRFEQVRWGRDGGHAVPRDRAHHEPSMPPNRAPAPGETPAQRKRATPRARPLV